MADSPASAKSNNSGGAITSTTTASERATNRAQAAQYAPTGRTFGGGTTSRSTAGQVFDVTF